jgi:osmotically-inducible protein OsmY
MALTLIADVYKDAVAMSTANVMAVANKRAKELGVDTLNSLITMTQYIQDGMMFWRVNYGAKDYLDQRGGDLIIDVDAINGKIDRILWGQ